jgi:hypothetical protein
VRAELDENKYPKGIKVSDAYRNQHLPSFVPGRLELHDITECMNLFIVNVIVGQALSGAFTSKGHFCNWHNSDLASLSRSAKKARHVAGPRAAACLGECLRSAAEKLPRA